MQWVLRSDKKTMSNKRKKGELDLIKIKTSVIHRRQSRNWKNNSRMGKIFAYHGPNKRLIAQMYIVKGIWLNNTWENDSICKRKEKTSFQRRYYHKQWKDVLLLGIRPMYIKTTIKCYFILTSMGVILKNNKTERCRCSSVVEDLPSIC